MNDYELVLGNSFEILPTLPDGSVDHVITDPPYAQQTHTGARSIRDLGKSHITFEAITDDQFLEVCAQAVRVARRWVVMTCDWRHAARAEAEGLPVVRVGVWIKPNGAPQFTGDRPGTGWEAVLILHRPGKKRWNGGGHHGVWHFPAITNRDEVIQPTQKPLPLIKQWLADFTDPGDTVLDPFAGSATTGVACLQTGRKFVGIEMDPQRHTNALHRLAQTEAQPLLFTV